jgi:CRP-like cAMP-binding protein
MTPAPLVDLQFIDARARVIDVAAFLDRMERHGQAGDYRVTALRQALREVLSDEPGRARRVLEALSDHTPDPIPAATIQGAFGAPRPA